MAEQESSNEVPQPEENLPSVPAKPVQEQFVLDNSLRRSLRKRKHPDRFGYDAADFSYLASNQPQSEGISFLSHAISEDPRQFSDVVGEPEWEVAMIEEYSSLLKNHTWDLVSLPKGHKLVSCKWVYRTKYASDGSVEKHNARLVAKGFSQVEGIDYSETSAPVAKMDSICLVFSLAASQG